MRFVSCKVMNEWMLAMARSIPNKYDLIVGIPRSGLRFGALLASKFGRPLTTPDCSQLWYGRFMDSSKPIDSILLVDDSLSSGITMGDALSQVKKKYPRAIVETAAVVVQPGEECGITYWYKKLAQPRVFEWNIAHGKWGKLVCDMDGVICQDLPGGVVEAVNPEAYEKHVRHAPPLFIPHYTIDVIVTCRMERWREVTGKWLNTYGVKFNQLLMWDIERPEERAGKHGLYKAARIEEVGGVDYVFESNWEQTIDIHNRTKLPVLCFDKMTMMGGEV